MGSFFDTRPLQLVPTTRQSQNRDQAIPSSTADDHTSPNILRNPSRVFSSSPSSVKDAIPQYTLQRHPTVLPHQGQLPRSDITPPLLDRLPSPSASRDSREQHVATSDPRYAPTPSNTQIPVTTRSRAEEGMKILSPIHTMIQQINRQFPREMILRTTVSGFMTPTSIDYKEIAAIFTQYNTVFRSKDIAMWQTIMQQIHRLGGFFIGRDQQRWFDELELEYVRLRTSLLTQNIVHG